MSLYDLAPLVPFVTAIVVLFIARQQSKDIEEFKASKSYDKFAVENLQRALVDIISAANALHKDYLRSNDKKDSADVVLLVLLFDIEANYLVVEHLLRSISKQKMKLALELKVVGS